MTLSDPAGDLQKCDAFPLETIMGMPTGAAHSGETCEKVRMACNGESGCKTMSDDMCAVSHWEDQNAAAGGKKMDMAARGPMDAAGMGPAAKGKMELSF